MAFNSQQHEGHEADPDLGNRKFVAGMFWRENKLRTSCSLGFKVSLILPFYFFCNYYRNVSFRITESLILEKTCKDHKVQPCLRKMFDPWCVFRASLLHTGFGKVVCASWAQISLYQTPQSLSLFPTTEQVFQLKPQTWCFLWKKQCQAWETHGLSDTIIL